MIRARSRWKRERAGDLCFQFLDKKGKIKMVELDNDGYPTEETLDLIEMWADKYESLMKKIQPLFEEYGRCEKRSDGTWEVATGGWSGNEEIIYALQGNCPFWTICWQLSKRGGYYEFKVDAEE